MNIAPSGVVHMKGAYVAGDRWAVCKIGTAGFAGESRSGCSFLLDVATGRPAAVLDDDGWLTHMWTAAAGALAADFPANPGDIANCSQSGELRFLPRAIRERSVVLADLVAGVVPGRTSRHQVTVADLCGIGTDDAAIAAPVAMALLGKPEGV